MFILDIWMRIQTAYLVAGSCVVRSSPAMVLRRCLHKVSVQKLPCALHLSVNKLERNFLRFKN